RGPATGVALGIRARHIWLWHGVELFKQREEPGEHGLVGLGFVGAERKVVVLRQPLQIVRRGDTKRHRCSPLVARGYPVSRWVGAAITPPASSYHRSPPGDSAVRGHALRLLLVAVGTPVPWRPPGSRAGLLPLRPGRWRRSPTAGSHRTSRADVGIEM